MLLTSILDSTTGRLWRSICWNRWSFTRMHLGWENKPCVAARFRFFLKRSSARQREKGFLNFGPHRRAGINNLKVSGLRQRNQFHLLAGFLLAFSIALADRVRHRIISGAVDQLLRRLRDVLFGGRSFTVVVRNFSWRPAQELSYRIVTQVQVPASAQVEHAGE